MKIIRRLMLSPRHFVNWNFKVGLQFITHEMNKLSEFMIIAVESWLSSFATLNA